MSMTWEGVMPAITTPFAEDLSIDHGFLAKHARWMVDSGVTGMVPLGSLGEGATLSFDEKRAILETLVGAVGDRVPVVPGISALSTAEAIRIAELSRECGCRGLMVLPPYVHKGDWREIRAHFDAVISSTSLPCMLYNNPIAYGTDVLPEQLAELASSHANLQAVKDSGGDVRRVTAVRALLGDRLSVFAGLDDMVVEAAAMGAKGWVAGLVNALPAESVRLLELARAGRLEEAFSIYRWFLPLLRLDTVPEFVQHIKLVQEVAGRGSARVRPPRLALDPDRHAATSALAREAIKTNPLEA